MTGRDGVMDDFADDPTTEGREASAGERGADPSAGDTPLYEEHLLLGAEFRDSDLGMPTTVSYPSDAAATESLHDGALLADLSGMRMLLLSGDPVAAFQEAAFAGDPLAVGEAAFSSVLVGDGTLASIPLAVRSGDRELLAFDFSSRAPRSRHGSPSWRR